MMVDTFSNSCPKKWPTWTKEFTIHEKDEDPLVSPIWLTSSLSLSVSLWLRSYGGKGGKASQAYRVSHTSLVVQMSRHNFGATPPTKGASFGFTCGKGTRMHT